jgi:hypothetical protein
MMAFDKLVGRRDRAIARAAALDLSAERAWRLARRLTAKVEATANRVCSPEEHTAYAKNLLAMLERLGMEAH